MDYFELYKTRVLASGHSAGDSMKNNTLSFINQRFKDSPNYKSIKLNGNNIDSRIVSTDKSTEKMVLFPSGTSLNVGDIISLNGNDSWLVMKHNDSEIYVKAYIVRCNEIIKWRDSANVVYSYPCVASTKRQTARFTEENQFISLLNGQLVAEVSYNDNTRKIFEKQRFLLGDKAYEVINIDDVSDVMNGKGILTLVLKIVVTSHEDDFENRIADNSSSNGNNGSGSLW